MSVAEHTAATPADPPAGLARERRWPWWLGIAALLAGAAALRVWGVAQGLPYAYNADENAHFVPGAIGLFGHGYNPHYFVNPPAYTYVLHAVFGVWFGGRDGVSRTFATDPTQVWIAARLTAGFFSTLAVGLLYLAGARLFGRAAGLLSAAVLAVAFLPVFYSHLALNDVVTLAPVALSLWGTAGIVRRGRAIDYVLAGVGLGLACATKYTGGIVLLPLLAAGVIRVVEDRDARARAAGLLVLSGALALLAFVAANPYVILDFAAFRDGLTHQADASNAELGKLGLTQESGHLYYLWTVTWGLGWVPALAALVGVGLLARAEPRLLLVLVPAPIVYVLFMGTQARFFGRWLLPAFPIACLLAGYAVARLAALAARGRAARLAPALYALGAVVLLGQGLVMSLHSGQLLARADTRNQARDWLVAHVPAKHADRRGARGARRVGLRHRAPVRGHEERRALAEVRHQPLERRQRRLDRSRPRADREHRGLRAHALPGPRGPLRAEGLLLRGDGVHPARARRGPAGQGPQGAAVLPRAGAPGPAGL